MSNNLKKWRTENKITVDDISSALNISPSYYYDIEKGRARLNEDVLNLLFEKFNVTANYVLNHSEEDSSNYDVVVEYAKGSNVSPERLKILIKHHLALMKEFE